MSVTRAIRYEGNPAFASLLVQSLRREGVTVEWEPPEEARGLETEINNVVVSIVAAGSWDIIKSVVKSFLIGKPPDTKAEIQGGRLFWFKTSPNGGVTVDAASLDDAKHEVARRGIAYQGCGEIIGPGDDFPPGVWATLEAPDS
jgi:hypothetical protein